MPNHDLRGGERVGGQGKLNRSIVDLGSHQGEREPPRRSAEEPGGEAEEAAGRTRSASAPRGLRGDGGVCHDRSLLDRNTRVTL